MKENHSWNKLIRRLIQEENYVGEVYSMDYEKAKILASDYHKHQTGGVQNLSFLVATRMPSFSHDIDFQNEDASVILLRVMGPAALSDERERERIKTEVAQRIISDKHFRENSMNAENYDAMDAKTRYMLSLSALECRILGTFYLDAENSCDNDNLALKFGSDVANFYAGRNLRAYKPNGDALREIVNYVEPSRRKNSSFEKRISIGTVRYASTHREFQKIGNVDVEIYPTDMLAQKTAIFGMSRVGKSNALKIIAKSIYELRCPNNPKIEPIRVGQIIFDVNGEYANENVQDVDGNGNPNALKNVYKLCDGLTKENEISVYSLVESPDDPDRKLMLLNFHLDKNLQIGKSIIDSFLENETASYIKNFCQVDLEPPSDDRDYAKWTRYNRRVLAYRTVLCAAGFAPPSDLNPKTKGLFNKEIINALRNSSGKKSDEYGVAANIFSKESPTWDEMIQAFKILDVFMRDSKSSYEEFETYYVQNGNGGRWADEDFKKIVSIFQYQNGVRKIGQCASLHSDKTTTDYADDIYDDLKNGKLVIIDQSVGDETINKICAERIAWNIFKKNQELFRRGVKDIPYIQIYLEEAHNLLPSDEKELTGTWSRIAKEGAKFRIGMTYSTQEVTSIQKNILKNTANWFIAHLNNIEEIEEVSKYYDFEDFQKSILEIEDKGFFRVKTLSNRFIIPVQIKKFDVAERRKAN